MLKSGYGGAGLSELGVRGSHGQVVMLFLGKTS
jgi:hypothetical protein